MNDRDLVRLSKQLATWLRHHPQRIGLQPDGAGWVPVEILLRQANAAGSPLSRAELDAVVARNNKQRYEFDESGTAIRARQGHSIPVELGYAPVEPPRLLYHGTAEHLVEVIGAEGLLPMRRHAVHLSADRDTAHAVGARHGVPVIFEVAADRMYRAGHMFHRTGNGVWLVDAVPPGYLSLRTRAGAQELAGSSGGPSAAPDPDASGYSGPRVVPDTLGHTEFTDPATG